MTIGIVILNAVLVAAVVAVIVGLLAWSVVASMNRPLRVPTRPRRANLEDGIAQALLYDSEQRGLTRNVPAVDLDDLIQVGRWKLGH